MNYSLPLTRQFNISVLTTALLLFIYSLLRLGFYCANIEFFTGVNSTEILHAFIYGMRFDISAILLINIPVLLLYNLPGNPIRWKWYKAIVYILFCIFNIAGIFLNVVDFEYYPTVQRRLLFEPFTMIPDLLGALPSLIVRYYWLSIPFFAGIFAIMIGGIKYFKALEKWIPYRAGIGKEICSLLLLTVLSVIGVRGGLQLKPIRQTNAFFSANIAVGYLTLNSTYTVTRSLFQPILPEYRLLPENQVPDIIIGMMRQDDEQMLDPDYLFLRRRTPQEPMRKLNVVLFIMESWTSKYNGCITGKRSSTPFFDSLASEGALFTNFIANGQRTIEAGPSILASVPGLFTASLIGSKAEMDKFRGLGSILMEQGYYTSFHHGASVGSMGFDAFAKITGFMNYFGKQDFPNLTDSLLDGVWGVHDEPFFLDAARRFDGFQEPFCSVIFSLSSHEPYEIPKNRRRLFEKYPEDSEFERSIRYSDFCLGQFFADAKTREWFKNTVFIITGDHTLFGARNSFYSSFHTPCLIYAPWYIRPQIRNETGSHVDILPTVLDILRIPTIHASMGRSLFDVTIPRYSVVRYGAHFGIFTNTYILVHDLESTIGLFEYQKDPFFKNDLQNEFPVVVEDLKLKLFAYLQGATSVLAKDRIFRSDNSAQRNSSPY